MRTLHYKNHAEIVCYMLHYGGGTYGSKKYFPKTL